jgi:immunity protein 63 of polymorphic toxin system
MEGMESRTLPELKREVDRLAAIIGAPVDLLPTYGQTRDFGYAHLEVDSRGYHYVVIERGKELQRLTTPVLDELLYEVFEHVTSSMGSRYAVGHRAAKQDFRRPMFQHQIELLKQLSPVWAQRCIEHHKEILGENPFMD